MADAVAEQQDPTLVPSSPPSQPEATYCDPSFEDCYLTPLLIDAVVRPKATALIIMDIIYLSNILLMPFCIGLMYAFDNALSLQTTLAKIKSGTWTTLTVLHVVVWFLPTVVITLYLVLS